MSSFKDESGREWILRLEAIHVDAFERATGESFFEHAYTGRIKTNLAWRLAYFVLKDEAEKAGFKRYEEWLSGIGKRAIGDMTKAVFAEISAFFPEAEAAAARKKDAATGNPPTGLGTGKTSTD